MDFECEVRLWRMMGEVRGNHGEDEDTWIRKDWK